MASTPTKPLQRRHIEALVAVGDSCSVHRAARELGMPQPAVSRLLAEAEQLLGVRLFERSSHGSTPTAQGATVLAQARFALRSIQRLNEVVTEAAPTIKLGCIPRAMYTLMPRLLDRMYNTGAKEEEGRSAGPKFRISVTEGSSRMLLDALSGGTLDFAIVRTPGGLVGISEEIMIERLYDDRVVIICADENASLPDSPIPLARLVDQGWVLPDPQTTSRAAFDRLWEEHGLPPVRPVMEVRSFEANLALVAGTRFISIAPESIVTRHAAFGVLRILKVRPALGASPVMLAFNRQTQDSAVLSEFRKLIHDTAFATRTESRRERR